MMMLLRQAGNWSGPTRFLVSAVLHASLLLAGGIVWTWIRPTPARAASGQPYTVTRVENVFDNTGTQRYTNYYVEALRADGSRMFRSTTKDVQKRELYFANGDHIRINELMGAKSTFLNESEGRLPARAPEASCLSQQEAASGWVVSGQDLIGGCKSARITRVAKDRTWTIWYGLDLNCAVLQERLQHETGVTEQRLTAVTLGEPDTALFQLSTALKESPPSQLLGCPSGPCATPPAPYLERIDRHYYEVRAAAGTNPR